LIIACISSATDMIEASYLVVKDMGHLLVDIMHFTYDEACALIAFYGDIRICQIVNPQKTVRIEIKNEYIDALGEGRNVL